MPGAERQAPFTIPLERGERVEVEAWPGNGGVVKAMNTATFPLGFQGAARAHIMVQARDLTQIDASFDGVPFRWVDSTGDRQLTAAIDAPEDGPISIGNRAETDELVIAAVLIEKGERFTVTTAPAGCSTTLRGGVSVGPAGLVGLLGLLGPLGGPLLLEALALLLLLCRRRCLVCHAQRLNGQTI